MAAVERRTAEWWEHRKASDPYKAIALLAVAAVLLLFFRPIFELLLAFYAAAVLAVAWNPVVERLPITRSAAALLIGALMLAAIAAFIVFVSGPLAEQVRGLSATLPELLQ